MTSKAKRPWLCPTCNKVWEIEKKTTTIEGRKTDYNATIYHTDFPKIDLQGRIKVCTLCRTVK